MLQHRDRFGRFGAHRDDSNIVETLYMLHA